MLKTQTPWVTYFSDLEDGKWPREIAMKIRQILLGVSYFLVASVLISCGGSQSSSPPSTSPTADCAAAPYFPCQQGWLGGDGAYSIPLGNGSSLWIFGDTFVGAADATSRTQSNGFVHNSTAISTCSSQSCSYQYYWTGMNTANPGPVFSVPGSSTDWLWPMDGFVYNGTLYLALMQMHATGSGGAFGFAYSGAQLASISNYTAAPSQWTITYQTLNTGGSAVPGASIVVGQGPSGNPDPSNPQGANYAYFFTVIPASNSSSPPYMALLRLPLAQLNTAARPGNTNWEYLTSDSTWGSWPDADTVLPADNAQVINPGATEMTVRYHSSTNQWIAVYPLGLDNSAYYAISSSMTGSWGQSESLYSYPEMQPNDANYTPNVFCYAAKEHAELEPAGQLFFTYACNSTQASDVTNNMNLYRPVVVQQPLPTE
jgi:Domain of unknown function (DUF4185)